MFAVKADIGNGSKVQWREVHYRFPPVEHGRGKRRTGPLLRRLRNIRHPYLKVAQLPVIALCICRFSRSQ